MKINDFFNNLSDLQLSELKQILGYEIDGDIDYFIYLIDEEINKRQH